MPSSVNKFGSKLVVDLDKNVLAVLGAKGDRVLPLSGPQAFEALSRAWLRCGFQNKYVYSFTWFGRPVIQLPEDLMRIQELVFRIRPHCIIETGVAHGGGVVFYSTLLKALGKGRVIGVDLEIRPHNRRALQSHPLRGIFRLVEGDSVAPETLKKVRGMIRKGERVLAVLDSNHSKEHVLRELEAYSDLVTKGSYLIVADGIMPQLAGTPLAGEDWSWNHPLAAVEEFLKTDRRFVRQEPKFLFNEGKVRNPVTYWPKGYLLKVSNKK